MNRGLSSEFLYDIEPISLMVTTVYNKYNRFIFRTFYTDGAHLFEGDHAYN